MTTAPWTWGNVNGEALTIHFSCGGEPDQELSLMPLGGPDKREFRRAISAYLAQRIAHRAKQLLPVRNPGRSAD